MHVEESVVVDRPIDEVWASLTDLFNSPRLWGRRVLAMRQTSPGPPGVGSTLQGRWVVLGFESRLNLVITEWDPPHVFGFSGAMRPLGPVVARWALEPVGNGTRIVRSGEFDLRGPLKLLGPFFRPLAMPGMRAASRNLKRFIEGKPR